MKKNMYSLMLSEHIINEIDEICSKEGKTRSALINEILAEKLNLLTPENRIFNIFNIIDEIFKPSNLECFYGDSSSIELKRSLNYKYKPTLKYELYLYKNQIKGSIGELRVSLRTTSNALINQIEEFLDYFNILENHFIEDLNFKKSKYEKIDTSKYKKEFIPLKNSQFLDSDIANYVSDYIKVFDSMLEDFINNKYTSIEQMSNDYIVKFQAN